MTMTTFFNYDTYCLKKNVCLRSGLSQLNTLYRGVGVAVHTVQYKVQTTNAKDYLLRLDCIKI